MSDSESSLDSELLAVAGRKKRGRKDTDWQADEESSEEVSLDEESDWEDKKATSKKKGSASKPPARKRQARGRGGKKAASSDEEEEEEAEESSDDEDRLEIDDEDLIEDEEDRKRLAAMTELQREFELANRAEKRNAEMMRQKLLSKTEAKEERAQRAGAKAAKAVGRSKSGREEREEAAKKSAMEELKAARERKARGAEERAKRRESSEEEEEEEEEERKERRGRGRRDRSDSEEEGAVESDDDRSHEHGRRADLYARGPGMDRDEDEEDEAPVEDVKKIQVRRMKLEEWVNEPFFEETLPGCMVRLVASEQQMHDGTEIRKYMVAQVVAVETRPPGTYKDSGAPWKTPYPFGPSGQKTSKWILVERGTSQRFFPLAKVSNAGFTDLEFESWQRTLKDQHRPQVSRRTVKDVHERLVKANNYTYTAADVNRLLQEKKAKGTAPRNAALEKARLESLLEHARETGDTEAVANLEAQTAELAVVVEEEKKRRHKAGMADLNKRNMDANFKNALDNVSNRPGGASGTQAALTSAMDPFSRRATRPMIYWRTKVKTAEEEAEEAAGGGGAAPPAGEQQAAAEDGQQRQGKLDLDSIVDLSSLDLSALERPARMPPLARTLLGPTWRPDPLPPGARILSMDEYRASRGW